MSLSSPLNAELLKCSQLVNIMEDSWRFMQEKFQIEEIYCKKQELVIWPEI